jgi:hypothetical protein
MTKNAINGSVINKTAFPGSEDGLSLVELVGTAEVTASISAIKLRLLASATTVCGSAGTAQTTKKAQLSAVESGTAAPSVVAYVKTPFSAYAQAACGAASGVQLAYRMSAVQPSLADAAAAYSYVAAKKSANTAGVAESVNAKATTLVSRGAASLATAVTAANALRKTAFFATGAPSATGIASITFRNRLGATAAPSVAWLVSSILKVTIGARATPTAVTMAYPLRKRLVAPSLQKALAICTSIIFYRKMNLNVTTQANASANAKIRLKFCMSASAIAQATGQATASDFASAIPAPAERLMTVQASDRRVEVTE